MRRIALWSAQRQNFVPFLALAVIVWIVILIAGIATLGLFGFSGTSLLLFIWLFFTWLIVTGIAALPIFLAIVVWGNKGVRWLWFHYRKRFWWIIPWGSRKAAKDTVVIRKPDQAQQKGKELEIYDKPKESTVTARKESGKGGTTPQSFTSQLTSTVRDLFRLIYGR